MDSLIWLDDHAVKAITATIASVTARWLVGSIPFHGVGPQVWAMNEAADELLGINRPDPRGAS